MNKKIDYKNLIPGKLYYCIATDGESDWQFRPIMFLCKKELKDDARVKLYRFLYKNLIVFEYESTLKRHLDFYEFKK